MYFELKRLVMFLSELTNSPRKGKAEVINAMRREAAHLIRYYFIWSVIVE